MAGEVAMQPVFGNDPSLGGPRFPMGGRMMLARGMAMPPAGGAPMAMGSAEEMAAPMGKGAAPAVVKPVVLLSHFSTPISFSYFCRSHQA